MYYLSCDVLHVVHFFRRSLFLSYEMIHVELVQVLVVWLGVGNGRTGNPQTMNSKMSNKALD
jgi:hypothetical protein